MGNDNNNGGGGGGKLKSEETILLLFTLFGILVVLFLLLIVVVLQTWALWRMAKVVVEQNTEDGDVARRKSSFGAAGFFGGSTVVGDEEAGAGGAGGVGGKKRYECCYRGFRDGVQTEAATGVGFRAGLAVPYHRELNLRFQHTTTPAQHTDRAEHQHNRWEERERRAGEAPIAPHTREASTEPKPNAHAYMNTPAANSTARLPRAARPPDRSQTRMAVWNASRAAGRKHG
ncbi:hypothetical protein K505DRAFT_419758 [Melanomma pulvis-pyrius CBS 109.77]|uniref:Uncharacterized protein n=1 Tax=Melanomma pulvis-pyrius CBS 109.77 TaxID=1314802 RepID=A0A6A6X2W6_9PLEO|nr:hypothetical protein K505DRAFT_419758 [Melanomma pulvis-pyrius CBS 109.77]